MILWTKQAWGADDSSSLLVAMWCKALSKLEMNFFFRKGYSVTTFFPFRSWYWNISRFSNHQNGLFSNISRFPADQESWLCNISKFRWSTIVVSQYFRPSRIPSSQTEQISIIIYFPGPQKSLGKYYKICGMISAQSNIVWARSLAFAVIGSCSWQGPENWIQQA